ncbi:hypothetical protein GQ600_11870 [Phytophthora cactorum]|nr:hypothetical protein GQ600_11870 [Phytophthora cactorum]
MTPELLVSLCYYNSGTYGTSSLLSPAMAKWQGPALYCVRLFLFCRMCCIFYRSDHAVFVIVV